MEILKERLALLKIPLVSSVEKNRDDFFHVEEKKEGIFASFSNQRTALYGTKRIADSLMLQEKDFFGTFRPKFLWRVIVGDGIDLSKMAEFGINAVLLDVPQEAFGLKVILRVPIPEELKQISPFDKKYREMVHNIVESLPPHDAIYWESPYFDRDCTDWLLACSRLRHELFLEELKVLESYGPLFYALPFKQAELDLRRWERHLGPSTYLVYSALDGDPAHSFLPASPYFHRGIPYFRGPQEGDIAFDREGVSRLIESACSGAFLHLQGCNLFLFAEALWKGVPPEASLARWWKLERKDIPFSQVKEVLYKLSSFMPKRDFIKAKIASREDQKLHGDLLMGEIKLFEKAWEMEKKKGQKNAMEQHFVNEVDLYLAGIKKTVLES